MASAGDEEPGFALAYRLYFLRHGETDWNLEHRLQGETDTGMNATGRAQAARHAEVMAGLGEDWAGFRFAVSPMNRARETFEIIRARLGPGIEPRFDERLREGSFGRWEGWTWAEVAEREPEGHATWLTDSWTTAPHGGETYGEIARRFADFAREIAGPTVVISHGGLSRAARALYLGLDRTTLTALKVPQRRFMRLEAGTVEWI
jgi:probable phosphoglycerate mutase